MSTTTGTTPAESLIGFIDADGWINRRPDADERIAALNAQPSDCGACGETFPNLDEVFSHPCPALSNGRPVALAADTVPADDVDYRPTTGTGTGRRSAAPAVRSNRFAGECAHCGRHIAAEAGELRKGPDGWQVIHLAGECAADHDEAPAPTPAPAPTSNCKPNRYAGNCHRCGGHVAAEAGFLCRIDNKWAVEHNGSCPETPAPALVPAIADVPAGRYAIESSGDNDLVFYRVDRPTEGPYAGRVFVKMVVGGHEDRNVAWRNIPGILARIADAGVMEATIRYGHELGKCGHCGRHLTDEASRAAGIGPVCAAKLGW